MKPQLIFFLLCLSFALAGQDYLDYHQQVLAAEQHIVSEQYAAALDIYEDIFSEYDFVFLRDYQVACQLAFLLERPEQGLQVLRLGVESGWEWSSIKKHAIVKDRLPSDLWKKLKKEYPVLRASYDTRLKQALRAEVQAMFKKDQWKALGAFLKFSDQKQNQYAENKFAPHSEEHMTQFVAIHLEHGYPGERSIGNNFWMSTILSHHNSISQDYNQKDQRYAQIRPLLEQSLHRGEMSPFEFALIDEWYRLSVADPKTVTYGLVDYPRHGSLAQVNALREEALLRPVEIRNGLLDIERITSLQLHIEETAWIDGAIEVKE